MSVVVACLSAVGSDHFLKDLVNTFKVDGRLNIAVNNAAQNAASGTAIMALRSADGM